MPSAAGVAFVLKELGKRKTRLGFDDVREQLPTEARLLRCRMVGQGLLRRRVTTAVVINEPTRVCLRAFS